ncbi:MULTISPECIES: acetate/propionate family kinase [Stappiaceae]|uniref:acetate/propionate family kinase n=1 Tax=Stappiaceae TaxID=2821832 RepID=UPI001446487C|nr:MULTISPECIES: acetate/propionate family kinase [Stappiaceae]NKX63364.1 acetate/propionate family kinase [Labrenzia sp. 5N]WJS05437.1 acetate/propionate family kinase [Roseibium aggregatum]
MDPVILVLNSGSSSIKFTLYSGDTVQLKGQISGLGAQPHISLASRVSGIRVDRQLSADEGKSHGASLAALLPVLEQELGGRSVDAVGHRVVHGGVTHTEPVRLTAEILEDLKALEPLAPLHQPHNLAGITAAKEAFPEAMQVACFDTAFHRSHPWVNDTFALPRPLYDEGVRRYGFHGLSYEYICSYLKQAHPEIYKGRLVVAHLGNGASMCAIREGQSIGSTMGFTALDGLPMGTRCGQLDPGVVLYLLTTKGMSPDAVSDLLYKQSGLKGLSGISQDMRTLTQSDDPKAAEAIDYFVFRIRRELGGMAAVLSGLDTVVFTGGIGENAALVREKVCAGQEWLGLEIDPVRNDAGAEIISTDTSSINVLVIPTDEEAMIRRHTERLLGSAAAGA